MMSAATGLKWLRNAELPKVTHVLHLGIEPGLDR